MKKAIVVGATSGMGKEIAIKLAENGYKVGIAGRRVKLLRAMEKMYPHSFIIQPVDISTIETAYLLQQLIIKLGGLDLLIMTAGFGEPYEQLNNNITHKIINTNVTGFTNVIDWGMNYFLSKGKGHLVSFSSVAGIRGFGVDPAYCASNSFQMNYLESLRQHVCKSRKAVYITDIRPGFVEKTTTGVLTRFWVTPIEKATHQIYRAIEKKNKVVYISKRWRFISFILKLIPAGIFIRILSPFADPDKIKFHTKLVRIYKPMFQSLVS